MEPILLSRSKQTTSFYKWASGLALITIFYNIVEGVISILFGYEDGTVALFGFGVDSFVEVISGIGIWHMVRRMKQNNAQDPDKFEKTALKITGTAFYILTVGLIISSIVNIYKGYSPETTLWGIIISSISILTMWVLIHYKLKIGRQYNSPALLADANCTKACIYLSVILLISSVGYEATGIGMIDSIGAAGIAIFSFKEGREAFEKAKGNFSCSCQGKCR